MRIMVEADVLVRAMTGDHRRQSNIARAALARADVVGVTVLTMSDLVRILSQGYNIRLSEIAEAIRRLINSANVVVDRPAVEAGLAMLDAGRDFADSIVGYQAKDLGAKTIVSFNKKAVAWKNAIGIRARVLS